eukprot:scaffold15964_cov135-Isochrysis_galbana.AAC.5
MARRRGRCIAEEVRRLPQPIGRHRRAKVRGQRSGSAAGWAGSGSRSNSGGRVRRAFFTMLRLGRCRRHVRRRFDGLAWADRLQGKRQ